MAYNCSIYPDKIVKRYKNDVPGNVSQRLLDKQVNKYYRENGLLLREQDNINLSKPKKSFILSATSKRTIINSILLLHNNSRPRKIKMSNDKFIYNFRTSFITLTLPSEQKHSDTEIKERLNVFLQNLRATHNLKNYVWKAELQKNGNLHFHIVIDRFIHHSLIRYYWNRALKPLGYIDDYKAIHSNLSLIEYSKKVNKSISECKEAYTYGKRTKWSSPNSTDVRSVLGTNSIANYLSKYIGKDIEENEDPERASNFGKAWGRSTTISAIKLIKHYSWEDIKAIIESKGKEGIDYITKVFDWCDIIYINYKLGNTILIKWIVNNIRVQSKGYAYPFP